MKKELPRKAIHIIFGTIFLGLVYHFGTDVSLAIITICFLAGLLVSIVIKQGYEISVLVRIIRTVERDYEKHWPGKAALLFFLAAIILLYVFGDNFAIVMAGLGTAVYGDAAAALVGKGIGKVKVGFNNTLEGTLAGFIVCILWIALFFPFPQNGLLIIIVPAIVATVAEYLPINDNLFMPLGASTALHFLLLLSL